jgi:Cu(I)/Ag(I) efflux system periplasmic protein CusF
MTRLMAVTLALLFAVSAAFADDKHPAGANAFTAGEVRKVDKEAKKVTIKHGEIRNLDMPAMTMVFQVKEPAMLDRVKAGDKVTFRAEQVGGVLTVVKIEPAK